MKKLLLLLIPALLAFAPAAAIASFVGAAPGGVVTAETIASADDALGAMQSALDRLRNAGRYTATAAGKTVAKKGFLSYEQMIGDTVVGRDGEFYARSESKSKFLKMKHEIYARGDTVVRARLIGAADGLLTYDYEIAPERGCLAVKKQMQAFGGLKTPPEFGENSRLTLTVREDYTPVALDTTDRYTIKFGIIGKVNCEQTMSYNFVYGDASVPDEALFTAAIGRSG